MKPFLEKIRPEPGASWAMLNRRLDDEIPFQWHHHPEYELTLTLNSRGQRFIGDHIGTYGEGDLVLVGPNLPHTWTSREKIVAGEPHVALVMWFLPEWAAPLGSIFAEMKPVSAMLARATTGLAFSAEAAAAVRPTIEALFSRPAEERLLLFLEVLARLAHDRAARPLASPGFAPQVSDNRERIDRVLDHLHQNYAGEISVAALADIAALSASGLHRLFRRHTGQTVSAYVIRLRVGEACALLSGSQRPIAHIASDVGYELLANFNRQFKALKGLTPRQYRQQFQRTR